MVQKARPTSVLYIHHWKHRILMMNTNTPEQRAPCLKNNSMIMLRLQVTPSNVTLVMNKLGVVQIGRSTSALVLSIQHCEHNTSSIHLKTTNTKETKCTLINKP